MNLTPPSCSVIELRQYTLHRGRRDELIALFEREFIEPQAALGLHVLGIFRDADAPERFVWLRGFADMAARRRALAAFYGGPVWQAHRAAANATMIDSDDVLLLRPLGPTPGDDGRRGPWTMTVWPTSAAPAPAVLPAGVTGLVTEPAGNDFPALPVRAGWHAAALAREPAALPAAWQPLVTGAPQRLGLLPTSRSPLQ